MGTVFPRQSDNMKFFAVLALAAVAFAEPEAEAKADPALLYGAYGYGLPYAGVYGGYRTYGAYPYAGYYYGKRSADAEPEADAEADPALLYGAYGYGAYPYSGVYGYRAYGAYPYTYGYYGKRSADADAEAEADPALLYTTSNVVSPLTTAYTHVAAPLTTAYAAVPAVTYTHSVAAPVVKTVVPQVATYSVPAVSTVHKAPAHGVAATYAGLVHSSHVGVCLNNVGVQVPC